MESEGLSFVAAGLPPGLSALAGDDERRGFFTDHPELLGLDTVDRLCEAVNSAARVDLETAGRLLDTAGWLSRELGDDVALGRFARASANLLLSRRELAAAVEQYEAAVSLFERAGEQRETARTLSTGLAALTYLGEFERAGEWAATARRLCERLGEPQLTARLEFNVGHSLAYQDRLEEALDRFRSAQRYFADGGRVPDVAAALRNIAVCQQQLHRFDAAVTAYGEARDYCSRHGLDRLALEVEYNIAYLHYLRGDYSNAVLLFEQARERCLEAGDRHHAALCELDLAELYLELNLGREAGWQAAQAVDEFEALDMPYETAKGLTLAAVAAARRAGWQQAEEQLERAAGMFAAQQNRYWGGLVELFRAQILLERQRSGEAGSHAAAALSAFQEIGIPAKIGLCELVLARVALATGDAEAAGERCAAALERLSGGDLPALEFRLQFVAGAAAEAAGRSGLARQMYERAATTLEGLRANLRAEELKVGLSSDQQAVYESLFAWQLEHGGGTAVERGFEVMQKAKSRGLAELLATRLGDLRPTSVGVDSLMDEIRELRAQASWLHRQIDREEGRADERSLERVAGLRRQSAERERDLLRRLRRLQSADPELASLTGSGVAGLAAVREALPGGSQLLAYFTARRRVYGCLIDGRRLAMRELTGLDELESLKTALDTQFGKFHLGPEYLERFGQFAQRATAEVLSRFHDRLLAPFEDALDGDHLVIAPHGVLHGLPFHAFGTGERCLAEHRSVSYAPSASVFQLCQQRPAAPARGALVLGVPDERAPLIEREARRVAELLPDSRLLLGEEASRDNLERLAAGRRYLHIATHGLFRRDNPMFSAVRLAGSRLSLFDLFNLRLDGELVVLSGCGTGLSAVQGADELLGLTRGLLYAGAGAVMVSLWDVNDESTSVFMETFYLQLAAGRAPAEALRRAQLGLRRKLEHPYYWAPFVLVGRLGSGTPAISSTPKRDPN